MTNLKLHTHNVCRIISYNANKLEKAQNTQFYCPMNFQWAFCC